MSKSSEADRPPRAAGFVLVEVLAALTIALIIFAALSESFSVAWNQARRPAESIWAFALARQIATEIRNGADLDSGDAGDFHYDTDIEPLAIKPLATDLPPAPVALADATETAEAKPKPGLLQLIAVTVTAQTGRQYHYESICLRLPHREK